MISWKGGGDFLNPSISVVMPAFNEEKTIEDTLSRTLNVMESICLPYEIIVVDDGSTDRTRERAKSQNVTLLTNGKNQGKGYALKRGFEHAKGDIIVTMDADGSHDPEDIKKLLVPVLNGVDIALGIRFADRQGKTTTRKLNMVGNHLINLLIQIITRKHITDSQTGFRAIKRRIIEGIEIVSKGYQVETELTVKTLRNGNKMQEIPIHVVKRAEGRSHLDPLRDGFKIFRTILASSVTSRARVGSNQPSWSLRTNHMTVHQLRNLLSGGLGVLRLLWDSIPEALSESKKRKN